MKQISNSTGLDGRAKSRLSSRLPIGPFLIGVAFASVSTFAAANQATGEFNDSGNEWAPSSTDSNNAPIGVASADKNTPINSLPMDPSTLINIQAGASSSAAAEGFPIPDNAVWGDLAAGGNLEGPGGPAIGLHSGSGQQVLVTVAPPIGVSADQAMQAARERKPEVEALVASTGGTVVDSYSELPIFLAEMGSDALAALAASGKVAGLETVGEYELHHESTMPIVRSDLMNDSGTTGSGYEGDATPFAVVVLDNGMRASHNAFAGRVLAEACYVNSPYQCPNGATSMIGPGAACGTSSNCFHGTHVSGTAIGAFENWGGLSADGVAPGAQLVAVDIFSAGSTFTTNIISGMNYALSLVNAGERIASLNMSLGGGAFTGSCDTSYPSTLAAIASLDAVGVSVVASAGNGYSTTTMGYPACLSNSIAVGNTQDNDNVAASSSTSPVMDLWAPGVDVDSAGPNSDTHILTGYTGTSMSAPHVSGAIALLRECITTSYPAGSAGADEYVYTRLQAGPSVTDNRAGGTTVAPRLDVVAAAQSGWATHDNLSNPFNASGSFNVNTACFTAEPGEPTHFPGSGTLGNASTFWASYTAPATGVYTFSTCDPYTGYDTVLAVYSGTNYGNLVQLAADDDDTSCSESIRHSTVAAPLYSGDNVKIAVRGYGSNNGNTRVNITQVSTFIPSCGGQAATQTGYTTSDTIYGTANDDVIVAGGGVDSVYGLGGNDIICLGGGNDIAYGGDGNDNIKGGGNLDTIYGNGGPDLLVGNNDNDTIYGGGGPDIIYGSAGDDQLYGDSGDDRVYGNNGSDSMWGGTGRDIMRGYADDDFMYGEDDIDNMSGGAGDDYMEGGSSNDTMFGNVGSDQLYGGSQNDYLNGGNSAGDFCDGGSGVGDFATNTCETVTNVP